jgi:hypothetical protein
MAFRVASIMGRDIDQRSGQAIDIHCAPTTASTGQFAVVVALVVCRRAY